MMKNAIVWICLLLVDLGLHPALAADSIPATSGFREFFLAGPGYFSVKSNLIVESRLNPADQPLLIREGEVWRAQALYRIDTENKRHRFEPAIRYNNDNHDGAAMSNQGTTLKLTYLYMTPKIVLDTNVMLGSREADAVHPVYGQTLDWNRYGVGLTAIIPVKLGDKNRWRVFVGGEFFREDANVDFFDTHVASILAGVLWRYNRP